jgi:hypothetical protein
MNWEAAALVALLFPFVLVVGTVTFCGLDPRLGCVAVHAVGEVVTLLLAVLVGRWIR